MIICRSAFYVLLTCFVGGISFVEGMCLWWDFSCTNGDCVPYDKVCNGVKDCSDGSDELNCKTSSTKGTTETLGTRSQTTVSGFWKPTFADVTIGSSPSHLSTAKNGDVVIQCKDDSYREMTWYKSDGDGRLPDRSEVRQDRLIIRNITCKDAGTYTCFPSAFPENLHRYGSIKIRVHNCKSTWSVTEVYSPTDMSSSSTTGEYFNASKVPCNNSTINGTCCYLVCDSRNCRTTTPSPANTFRCSDGSIVPLSSKCDGIKNCLDGSDELNCRRLCNFYEFRCGDGTCISGANYCDGEIDCVDASDEKGCSGKMAPRVTELPSSNVEVECQDRKNSFSSSRILQLECRFAGKPTPIVKWKKYNGDVSSKCFQSSLDGHGILKCPDFQQSDQGAYSCVAENMLGSAESQPKSVVKCRKIICDDGFKVTDEHGVETCLDCFCSGKNVNCSGIQSDIVKHDFEFPTTTMHLLAKVNGEITMPNDSNVNILDFSKIEYCSVPEDILLSHSFIESYGRNINIPATHKEKSNFLPDAPDVIIGGDGLMLMYSFNKISHSSSRTDVRFWEGNWYHNDKRVASRRDIMNVLAHLDLMLFRCNYREGIKVNLSPGSKITLESSKVTDYASSVSYLEKCNCPKGYTGLSCQICAPGFERDVDSSDFICKPKITTPSFCPLGTKRSDCSCATNKLHYLSSKTNTCELSNCTGTGSIGLFPDEDDNCICKERVTGKNCDRCKEGFFYLDAKNPLGCKKCWCNNVTTLCSSSKWYRSTIFSTSWGGYNASDGGNFWLLPPEFNGNRLTSYGGFLKYKMNYVNNVAKQPRPLSVVILSASDVTFKYVDSNVDLDVMSTEKSWKVPIEEPFWRDDLNFIITRERLLQALVNVKAIYIESPYHLSSGSANITRVELDVAEDMSNYADPEEDEKASKVEQCSCPVGYEGLSCESCSEGYYKKRTELGGFECEKCDCENCDPERGCMTCKKGEYQGNPGASGPPVCFKCPCNGNEEYCLKDELEQVVCFCKSGYSGIYCESSAQESHLRVSISPYKVVNKEVGSLVTFNCSYDSPESMQISFQKKYKTNRVENAVQIFKKIENLGSFSIIEIAMEEDLLAIECIVRNMSNHEKGRVLAVINTAERRVRPKITNCYEEPPQVIENEDLQLICEATGLPEPVVSWYIIKNNKSEKLDTVNGVHTIPNASLQQNATSFLCIAENAAGEDKCSTFIIVKKRCDIMSIIPSNLVIKENQAAEFNCSTTSRAEVTWSFNGGPLPFDANVYDGRLFIKSAKLFHSGEYNCSSRGSDGPLFKTAMLSVMKERVPPKAVIREEDMAVKRRDWVVINCDVSGYPEPRISWKKIGSSFLPLNVLTRHNNSVLEIRSMSEQNIGFYECVAESGLQFSRSRIHVTLAEEPEIKIIPENIISNLGDNVTIECRVLKGLPFPTMEWSKILNGSGRVVLNAEGNILRLYEVDWLDEGKYECEAVNSAGKAAAVAKLSVGTPPSIVLKPEGNISAIVGDVFDIECSVVGSPQPTLRWLKWQKMSRRSNGNGNGRPNGYSGSPKLLPETGKVIRVTVTQDLHKITCVAENVLGKVNKSIVFAVQGGQNPKSDTVKRVKIGSRVQLIFNELVNVVKCRRSHSSLIGDECYIRNGLEINSVQVQHNGTYICTSDTGREMSSSIIVVGFVNKFTKEGRSYLRLPLGLKSRKEFDVEVTFKADNSTGVILLKKYQDFSMYLADGKLKVRLQRPPHHIVLEPGINLKLQVWYTAVFRFRDFAELSIYDDQGNKLDSAYEAVPFEMDFDKNYEDDLYIGGARLSGKKLPLKWRDAAFGGCISRLIVDDHEFKITEEATYSKNVSLCNVCSSGMDPCGSEGVCYDAPTHYGYVCVCGKGEKKCPRSCNGLGCNTKHDMCKLVKPCNQPENKCTYTGSSMECSCTSEYSGLTCKDEVAHQFSLNHGGYVKLPPYYLPRHSFNEPENITIDFASNVEEGLLLFQLYKRNYLYIYANQNSLVYIYKNQGTTLRASGDLDSFLDHKVMITRRNNTVEMNLDDGYYVGQAAFSTNRISGEIYLGGIPAELYDEIADWFPYELYGFRGCINGVTFGKADSPVNVMAEGIVRHNFRKSCSGLMNGKESVEINFLEKSGSNSGGEDEEEYEEVLYDDE